MLSAIGAPNPVAVGLGRASPCSFVPLLPFSWACVPIIHALPLLPSKAPIHPLTGRPRAPSSSQTFALACLSTRVYPCQPASHGAGSLLQWQGRVALHSTSNWRRLRFCLVLPTPSKDTRVVILAGPDLKVHQSLQPNYCPSADAHLPAHVPARYQANSQLWILPP
ncbi:hypothetical protein BCR44DRAFT_1439879 [Catenaria anguillulae PL171]|uniref:Uncharacterized protein n=1 Tax=Catenaria anguillulae PL171 TaxID=765915 RepID=A0A1Y2HDD9_9FUNG|nr:hypothetical protein BCR44DRAFT_1439879 [Catenaria anguillulae PL171]